MREPKLRSVINVQFHYFHHQSSTLYLSINTYSLTKLKVIITGKFRWLTWIHGLSKDFGESIYFILHRTILCQALPCIKFALVFLDKMKWNLNYDYIICLLLLILILILSSVKLNIITLPGIHYYIIYIRSLFFFTLLQTRIIIFMKIKIVYFIIYLLNIWFSWTMWFLIICFLFLKKSDGNYYFLSSKWLNNAYQKTRRVNIKILNYGLRLW